MRTPAPPDCGYGDDESINTFSEGSLGLQVSADQRLDPTTKPQGSTQSRYKSNGPHQEQDPRVYLIKRRKSRTQSGRRRRLTSKKLPLETIPATSELSNITRRLNLKLVHLKMCMDQYVSQGLPLDDLKGDPSLQFRAMGDVEEVEARLKQVVNQWSAGTSNGEVEYCLRSGVKGMSRI